MYIIHIKITSQYCPSLTSIFTDVFQRFQAYLIFRTIWVNFLINFMLFFIISISDISQTFLAYKFIKIISFTFNKIAFVTKTFNIKESPPTLHMIRTEETFIKTCVRSIKNAITFSKPIFIEISLIHTFIRIDQTESLKIIVFKLNDFFLF